MIRLAYDSEQEQKVHIDGGQRQLHWNLGGRNDYRLPRQYDLLPPGSETTNLDKDVSRSESDLLVFISSRMNSEMEPARKIAVESVKRVEFGRPWAFEYTSASTETAEATYLRKVREADFVVWLVGSETTQPVVDEINEAMAFDRRLLVFKLPAKQRDSQTEDLLERVGDYTKWKSVDCIEDLSNAVNESFADAMVQAVRNPFTPARRRKLLQDSRLSVARCKEQLVSLGVEESVADKMANDRELGHVLETPATGAFTVVGEQGSGKSLAVERLFQRSAADAAEDSSRPFPILVRARDLTGPLPRFIEASLHGYTDAYNPRVLFIIDGVDEVGPSRATDILRQVAAYVDANSEATVISTTRALPNMGVPDQQIKIEALEDKESLSLVERMLGRPIEARDMQLWPQSIRQARRIPLFAVMIGTLLRDQPDLSFSSSGQVIGQVADQLLRHEEDNPEELDRLLQLLAVKAIESGTRVDPDAITPVRAKQAMLRGSRVVEGTTESLDFALPVFREWYASRALIERAISVDRLQSLSDRWIPPLSVVLGSGVDDVGEAVLAHIASIDPGLAGILLKENTPDPIQFWGKVPVEEDPQSFGIKVREAMALWKTSLGELYHEIGPVNTENQVSTLAIQGEQRYLTTSWYAGQSLLANIVELRDYLPDRWPNFDWPVVRHWEIEPDLSGPSWWHYFKTQEQLSESLSEALDNYSLASDSIDFRRELAWNFALQVRQRGALQQEPLGIARVLEYLDSLGPNTTVVSNRGRDFRPGDLEIVAQHLSTIVEQGETEVSSSWPGPDLPFVSGSIWNLYSDEQLLKRAKEVYSGAIRIYVSIVERWLPRFSRRLPFYRIFPVRLEGWIQPGRKQDSQDTRDRGPVLDWYVRILPEIQPSEVSFELDLRSTNGLDREFFDRDELFEEERSAFDVHRSNLPGAFSMTLTRSSMSELLDPYPATELAHSWLRHDLKELGWER